MPTPDARMPDFWRIVDEARKQPRPVYLFIGEPFQTEQIAKALIDALVPRERQSLNVERYDGRAISIGTVLGSLRMRGLFGGVKAVWVREPVLFVAGEKKSDLADAMFAAWAEERPMAACEYLVTLAAMAGWSEERFAELAGEEFTQTAALDLFGRRLDEEERAVVAAIHSHCVEQKLRVNAYRDESGLLQQFLDAGMPPDTVLIFTSAAVDRRKKIVKTIQNTGVIAELVLERERSGALTQASVDQLIDQKIIAAGKRLTAGARRLISERAGHDGAALAMELEKLVIYAGEAATIEEDDVRQSMRDLGESWVFDFTRALTQRNAAAALRQLARLSAQGEPPLRLLALIAREVRNLLLAHDLLTGPLARQWSTRMQYNTFRDRLLPSIGEEQRAALGNMHPFALYLCLQNAAGIRVGRLHRAVRALHELDVQLKSSAVNPWFLLERFVIDFCRPDAVAAAGGSRA